LALFGKKKSGDDASETTSTASNATGGYSPEKAAKFFEHARAMQDATQYEYAMQLWLRGLIQDPTSMSGLEGFLSAAAMFLGSKGKVSKETKSAVSGRSDAEKYAAALLETGLRPGEGGPAVKATEMASKLDLGEQAYELGKRSLTFLAQDKKPTKDQHIKLMRALAGVGAFDLAAKAGDGAVRLDPGDGELSAEVRNMSAQAAMTKGGFDETGAEGGFRKNIRDADKQRLIEEQERVVKTEESKDRLVRIAEEAWRARPDDLPSINGYIKALRDRGAPEDMERALKVAMKAHEDTHQFRYRREAGEIKLRLARRKLEEYRQKAEANPEDAGAQKAFRDGQVQYVRMETDEYRAVVEAYPTDLGAKFELAKRLVMLRDYEPAIELLQEAKEDAKNRSAALALLGQAFQAIDWNDEAIATYRAALAKHSDENDEQGMELRYGLMCSLQAKAENDRDVAAATEAETLASGIAIQSIGFKDIRQRREAIKNTLKELRGG